MIVYHVEANGQRKLYDGDGSEMEIYVAQDHGKKRAALFLCTTIPCMQSILGAHQPY